MSVIVLVSLFRTNRLGKAYTKRPQKTTSLINAAGRKERSLATLARTVVVRLQRVCASSEQCVMASTNLVTRLFE